MGLESDLQWRDAVCYGAEKCSGPAEHHTKAGLPVCREQALKSVGERNTHGGVPLRGPSGNRPRKRSNTSGWRDRTQCPGCRVCPVVGAAGARLGACSASHM